jgi:hypothetical protein
MGKICRICGDEETLQSPFPVDAGRLCKACEAKRKAEWYQKNKERINKNKKWVKKSPEKEKEHKKRYREKNADKIKAYNHQWYLDNAERQKERARRRYSEKKSPG